MKINTISTLMLALFPGFAFADLIDFGTTTKANKDGGFLVTGVFQATPAAEIGIAEGDVITKLDGRKLNATAPLSRLIAGVYEAESTVQLDWLRGDVEMTGKALLDKTLSDEAFDERYPKSGPVIKKKLSPEEELAALFSDDISDVEIGGLEDLKDMGIDVGSLQDQIQKALEESNFGALNGNVSTSFSTMMMSSGGNTITVSGSGEKRQVKIESKDGETIFDDKISIDELDKVPAAEREQVKRLMKGDFSVKRSTDRSSASGAGSIGGIGEPSQVEESAADLLKKLEEENEEDEKGEEK